MRNLKIFFAIALLVPAFSFIPSDVVSVAGSYGVPKSDNTILKLELNEDGTFHYVNHDNPSKKIDLRGNWTMKGDVIKLINHNADFPFHDKWTLDKKFKCLKSRNGLNFMRICFLD